MENKNINSSNLTNKIKGRKQVPSIGIDDMEKSAPNNNKNNFNRFNYFNININRSYQNLNYFSQKQNDFSIFNSNKSNSISENMKLKLELNSMNEFFLEIKKIIIPENNKNINDISVKNEIIEKIKKLVKFFNKKINKIFKICKCDNSCIISEIDNYNQFYPIKCENMIIQATKKESKNYVIHRFDYKIIEKGDHGVYKDKFKEKKKEDNILEMQPLNNKNNIIFIDEFQLEIKGLKKNITINDFQYKKKNNDITNLNLQIKFSN